MITVAFLALWILWVLLSVPYAIYEFNTTLFDPDYRLMQTLKRFVSVMGDEEDFRYFTDTSARFRIESVLFSLKQSFSFFNAFLMLILIRPFQEPIKLLFKKLKEVGVAVASSLKGEE